MRRALTISTRRPAPPKTLSPSTATPAAALSSKPLLPQPRLPAPSRRRWLSASPAPHAPQQQQQQQQPPPPPPPDSPSSTTTPAPLAYYALFPQTLPAGPPPNGPFAIDVRALRREFLQLQAASHPDFHHAAAASSSSSSSSSQSHSLSRRKAEALSSHINAAYQTLATPLLRAQYLLSERHGLDLAGDEASRLTGPPDAALLGEVMAAREAVEEAVREADLDELRAENAERVRVCLDALAAAFAAEDVAAAVRETVRLRYWENIRESVEAWEEGKPVVLQH